MRISKLSNVELLRELETVKSDSKKALELLREINLRIDLKKLNFKGKENKFLYIYMLVSNKNNYLSTINSLITEKEFVKELDKSPMNGSTIIALTNHCLKPRKTLLKNSQKIKESIINSDELFSSYEILEDLTKEEVKILREDIEIDNYLITNGLRFDTLKKETIEILLSDIILFENYNISTIRDFTNNIKEAEVLANNPRFLAIYLRKLDDDFTKTNKIFSKLTIRQVKELKKDLTDFAYLHLIKDASPKVQNELLQEKKTMNILLNCNNINILEKLPKDYLISLLEEKEHLLSGVNYIMLRNLNKHEIAKIAKNNKHFYSELVEKITLNNEFDYKPFVSALPPDLLHDLSTNHLNEFNFEVLKKLLNTNKSFFKDSILNNKQVSNYLINSENTSELLELLDDSDFNNEEKIRLLNNCEDVKKPKNVCAIIETLPETLRLPIYKNDYLRSVILSEKSFILDSYTTKYLLNNYNETLDKPINLLINLIILADNKFGEELLASDEILNKVFKEGTKEPKLLKELLKNKPNLLNYFQDAKIKKYYNTEVLTELKDLLDPNEMNTICTNEVIESIYKDPELIKVYKKLLNNNSYLLNTLNFSFINENTKGLKLIILDKYTKYPSIQKNILEISKKHQLTCEFLNQLYFASQDLDFACTVNDILEVLKSSIYGENRKRLGNLGKILKVATPSELSKNNFHKLINYLLYFVPRNGSVKENLINTPSTFNDIIKYEENINKELTKLINKKENIRENFLLKHFKLNSAECLNILNNYSIERIDKKSFKKEIEILNELQFIFNADESSLVELDSKYKNYTMLDSFIIEEKLKKMYGNIYNCELRSKSLSSKQFYVNIFGKELRIYTCPNDFMFLISNVDIADEYEKTNSFFLGWHNTINKIDTINASLIANDNLHINKDIIFGFNGLMDYAIRDMSPYYKKHTKYMTPRELIDNTRDINNHLLLDKFAIRPNFNNSNLPNVEPDYLLVDANRLNDNTYLEKISRASEEFKSKRNKDGLPIIAIDQNRLSDIELSKISTIFSKYQRNHDMHLLNSIITKINNNVTAYRTLNKKVADKFDISILYNALIRRIKESNSISEIEFIENLFVEEEKKYKYLIKDYSKEEEVKALQETINVRINKINKG